MNDRGLRKPGVSQGLAALRGPGGTWGLGETRGRGATGGLGETRGCSTTGRLGAPRGLSAAQGQGAGVTRRLDATRRPSASATCCYQGSRPVPAARTLSASASCCYPPGTADRGAPTVASGKIVDRCTRYSVVSDPLSSAFRPSADASRCYHGRWAQLLPPASPAWRLRKTRDTKTPYRGSKYPASSTSRANPHTSCCYLGGDHGGRTVRADRERGAGASCCYQTGGAAA